MEAFFLAAFSSYFIKQFCRSRDGVKREGLDWLADNPFYTRRFAYYVGRRCRAGTIKDVARQLPLDWHTVKELEKQHLREQMRRSGQPGPRLIRHRRDIHSQRAQLSDRGQ